MSMMHQFSAVQVFGSAPRAWRVDGVRHVVARQAGWLAVSLGTVWITQDGGGMDHVLGPGERLWLGRGESFLVEPWRAGEPAQLSWRECESLAPRTGASAEPAWSASQPLRLAPEVGVGRSLAFLVADGLRAAAGFLLRAARSAEAMANRAQGSMRAGDSMASSGAVQ